MDRRNVLKLGAVAGFGGLGGAGCATAGEGSFGTAAPPLMPDLDAFLARLDHGMSAIATGNPLKDLLAKARVAPAGAVARPEDLLIKKSLRSLLMAGSFRDLNEAERAHPAVQARIWGSMQEMDEAVFGMTHVLEGFSPSERAKIRETIQSDPDIGMRIAEALDTDASTADVSLQRRTHLRAIASQLTWRLKNQPIETAIDEYVGKVKKVSARNGYTEEFQRKLAAQAATSLFIAQTQGQPAPGAAPAQPGAPVQAAPGGPADVAAPQPAYPPGYGPPPGYPPGYGPPPGYPPGYGPPPGYPPGYGPPPGYVYAPNGQPYYVVQPPVATGPRGGAAITVGAILLGLGIIVGAVGFATLDGAGVVAITVGALLLLGGLITLIVGLVLRASST